VLVLTTAVWETVVAHCLDGAPLEACGILGGRPAPTEEPSGAARVERCWPTTNAAGSARVYTVDPRDMLRADREAEAAGVDIIGVWHSHTHTEAYPSPTDVAQAPDPGWHYVLVSLRDVEPSVRSFRIRDGKIEEEQVVLE
jgi:proteasome lid subunit RPN8/RPN11